MVQGIGERTSSRDALSVSMTAGHQIDEGDGMTLRGHFDIRCLDNQGRVLWEEGFDNLVTTAGRDFLLDSALAGSAYTAVEYLSLISSVGFTTIVAGDTMGSHAGWYEVDGTTHTPSYGATRPTATWAASSGGVKSLASVASFVFANGGTIQGGMLVGGAGASATVGNTGGVLISAGTLTTPQPVIATNTITMGYTLSLTG